MKTPFTRTMFIVAGIITGVTYVLFAAPSFSQTAQQTDPSAEKIDQKIRIKDSHGKWAFDEPPKRIAVINWTLTEQLFELGVTPVAIADLKGFQKTSPQTQLPLDSNTIVDLGSRFTPNLSQLKASQPELIIIGYSQRDLLRPLSNIAPVMYFNNFSRRNNNAAKADERFLILAKLFDKTNYAVDKLSDRDKQIQALKSLLNEEYLLRNQRLPKVTIASRKGKETWAYLNNSIPYSVIQTLGLTPELAEKPTKLGTHKLNDSLIEKLQGCLILINNSASTASMKQPNCTYSAKATNTFGGAMSQLYLANSFTDTLLKKLK